MAIFAVSRHIPSDFRLDDAEKRARQVVKNLRRNLPLLGVETQPPQLKTIIISSPVSRVLATAEFFADDTQAAVEQNEAFGENIMPERLGDLQPGVKILTEKLHSYELVWLVTHQPLVNDFFGRVAGAVMQARNSWVSSTELFYGIHAINLETRILFSWGYVR